ncbi:hypothetical protein VNI00_002740 [Paramarasmius palmivorus]|uniref:C3H1-type domain-containing protein n=1 Tax=Paramarasmius palmivorus TaxID=297713 RepID=A0AAW0DYL7_9AGAR
MSTAVDRPSTSKPRGICKYYQTSRGCFSGKSCKFLHGDPANGDQGVDARLTPYDQSKSCKFFAKGNIDSNTRFFADLNNATGFCKRGDKCWFQHASPYTGDEKADVEADPVDELCSICFEKPNLYGLLTGCNHQCQCIKQWRDPTAKSVDVVDSGVHKKCPMCRMPSKFITPSSLFFKNDDLRKAETISKYKQSMARVPCKYFTQSKAKDKKNPFCPFGKDCFYQHLNDDGTPYSFKDGVDESMRRYQQRLRPPYNPDSLFADIFETIRRDSSAQNFTWINRLLDEPQLGRLQNTLQAVRNSLQHLELANSDATGRRGATASVVIAPEPLPPLDEWNLEDGSHWEDRMTGPVSISFSMNDATVDSARQPPHQWWHDWRASDNDDDDIDEPPPPLEAIPGLDELTQDRNAAVSRADNDDSESDLPPLQDVDDTDSDWSTTDDETEGRAERCTSGPFFTSNVADDLPPPLENVSDSSGEDSDGDSESSSVEPARPPPFVTDGRGRVIGASAGNENNDNDTRRSFLSRVMDALF